MPLTRIRLELENRFSLLLTHGLVAWVGGGLVLFFGFGTVLAQIDGARLVLGLLGAVGGAVLHAATVGRRKTGQLVGMVLVGLWYAALFAAYLRVMLESPAPLWSWPWEPSVNPAPPYAVAVFGGLVVFAIRQGRTLWAAPQARAVRAYLRRRRHVRAELARLALIDELFDRVHAANPCPTPDCIAFRDEIHQRSKSAAAPSVLEG